MNLKFKPEDFESAGTIGMNQTFVVPSGFTIIAYDPQKAANIAQQIFDAWLKENEKVVYLSGPAVIGSFICGLESKSVDTHKAILINIEPIEKCPKEFEEVK